MTEMLRYNQGKPKFSYLPLAFTNALFEMRKDFSRQLLVDTTAVLDFGAQKYSRNNWRRGGKWSTVADSCLRHLVFGLMAGEVLDPESGLPHTGHIGCNIAFLLEFIARGVGEDDRYIPELYQDNLPLAYDEDPTRTLVQLLQAWLEGAGTSKLHQFLAVLSDNYEALNNRTIEATYLTDDKLAFPELGLDIIRA